MLERALLTVRLGRDLRLADLTSRRALQFGVTASLDADEEYAESQRFAVRALESGFAGIRHLLRHDPAQKLYEVALLGDPGESSQLAGKKRPDGPLPGELPHEASRLFGHRIVTP